MMRTLIFAFCIILIIANSLAAPAPQDFLGDSPQPPDGETGHIHPRKGKRESGIASVPQSELTSDDAEDPNMHFFSRPQFNGGNGMRGPRRGRRDFNIIPQSELSSRDETDPVAQNYITRELPGGGAGRRPRKGDMWSDFDQEAKTAIEKALQDNLPFSDHDTKTIWEEMTDDLYM
ncbi:uncharacterized protein LOC111322392 [Stylophora pistillata]|uniref:uncharacterized protein LOC111322392 n=1 Tax=Stylophora pistillata TaxID=50429 RepID=UPI000C03AF23|nr:uncharacterized protein LOC111322392 [Stylophora pistillata]